MDPKPHISLAQPELVNLSRSLGCEILSTNHSGGYLSTTAALCNTRKYHGLMVLPLEHFGGERHVLLSTLDETIAHGQSEFHLSLRRYPNVYEPRGHKYLERFDFSPTPTFLYRVGSLRLRKELLFLHTKPRLLIRYTLEEGPDPVTLRLMPFLAFRNAHALCRANMHACTDHTPVAHGMAMRLYPGFPTLHLQTSLKSEYVHAPHWHHNVEYARELERGYPGHEDLLVPGYLQVRLTPGRSVILSVGTEGIVPQRLSGLFRRALQERPPRGDAAETLRAAGDQFLAERGPSLQINAGYHWFGRWGRDTLIALPGLTIPGGHWSRFERVLGTLLQEMRDGMLPNMGSARAPAFNSVDAPLWLFATVQSYCMATGQWAHAGQLWGRALRGLFGRLASGEPLPYNIAMRSNGLIWAGARGHALTWMDAIVGGEPVTPRIGYDVEINALWYNASLFMLELAERAGWGEIPPEWQGLPARIREGFLSVFPIAGEGYLADYVDEQGQNRDVRPNQILAVSLPYTPLPPELQRSVLERVQRELYTPFGLRTLSPKNPRYRGRYEGDPASRDSAYHQGTIWTWLLDPYVAAYERVNGAEATRRVTSQIVEALTGQLGRDGLGTLSEIYDGDPPHTPRGTIAQAWSVSAALRILQRHEALTAPDKKQ